MVDLGSTPNGTPVRVSFTNSLPADTAALPTAGNLFLPVDTTIMGAGMGPGGSIYSIGITNGGVGYTSAPAVVIAAPPTGGVQATAVASINNGKVVSVTVSTAVTPFHVMSNVDRSRGSR